ncbi:hypothetical protein diail_6997 [Diaporthe ilicicola]|nr:hypothetical protein diail_6997 [Diaporthe ilicicola]
MISPSFFVALLIAALAAAQASNTTTYNVTISWYGTNDPKGSPNCNSNTVACGFYTYPGYAAAVSQNLFGAGPGEGKGPACGTCYRLTIETDAQSGNAVPNAGSSIVVKVNNLCPADGDDPICAQPDLQTPNQYGGVVDFNLCNDDGAHAALLAPANTGLAGGTAVMNAILVRMSKRIVLIAGEGSLQLTVQAFSILNRNGITPIVLIINNLGYTVERYFNGMEAAYNDVPMWDYGAIFQAMSPEASIRSFKVDQAVHLNARMCLMRISRMLRSYPQCVDMMLSPKEVASNLKKTFEIKEAETAAKGTGSSLSM